MAFEVLFTYSLLLSPVLIVLYIALLIGHEKVWLKPIAPFAWAYPAACLLVVGALYCVTGLGTRSHVYRLGMDVDTPHGVVSCGSMVEVVDEDKPISTYDLPAKGEYYATSFCNLHDFWVTKFTV